MSTLKRPLRTVLAALLLGLLCLEAGFTAPAQAQVLVERRRDQFGKDFGYFIYPIASEIPGLGTAAGGGVTLLNMFGTDADFTGFKLQGDFDVHGYTFLDLHLIKNLLVLDVGDFGFHVVPTVYKRGITSSPTETIHPEVTGRYKLAQFTLTMGERLFEAYWRPMKGRFRLNSLRDRDGNLFPVLDASEHEARQVTVGGILDNTDDRLDPRVGLRAEYAQKTPENDDPWTSAYRVDDLNLSAYVPVGRFSTLAFNFYRSDAKILRQASTDYATLQGAIGLNCGTLPAPAQPGCLASEAEKINDRIVENTYGSATPLGGTQRLRAYPGSRFRAGHSLFYGIEQRWNLNDERTPFDVLIARGIRTGFQAAFFAERGTVNDDASQLWSHMRTSYGVGFRMLLTGVIVRADWARGDEGNVFTFFINYPWGMFSVDNPG